MARISKPPEERRQELIETSKVLFERQGYEATTVGDIVRQVGVAQGLFYYYFRSKREIFLAVVDQFIEEHIGELVVFLRKTDVPPLERVRNLMQVLLRFLREMEVMYPKSRTGVDSEVHAIMQNHVSEAIEPMVASLLRETSEQGLIVAPFPDLLARFFISGFLGVESMANPPKAEQMMELIWFALEQLLHIPKNTFDAGE